MGLIIYWVQLILKSGKILESNVISKIGFDAIKISFPYLFSSIFILMKVADLLWISGFSDGPVNLSSTWEEHVAKVYWWLTVEQHNIVMKLKFGISLRHVWILFTSFVDQSKIIFPK